MSASGPNVAAGGRVLLVHSTVKQRYYIVARGSGRCGILFWPKVLRPRSVPPPLVGGRCQTEVLRIAQHSGKLQFTRTKAQDIFDSEVRVA